MQHGLTRYRAHAHVINLLNRVPGHDCLTFFMLHRTKCKPMHFEWESFSDVTLTLTLSLTLNLTVTETLFKMHWFTFRSVEHKKNLENHYLGHDS